MQLELSPEDRVLLETILDRTLADLRVEVRRTTTPKFHDDLLAEEDRLRALLARVKALG